MEPGSDNTLAANMLFPTALRLPACARVVLALVTKVQESVCQRSFKGVLWAGVLLCESNPKSAADVTLRVLKGSDIWGKAVT